jgi:hypothetical protein
MPSAEKHYPDCEYTITALNRRYPFLRPSKRHSNCCKPDWSVGGIVTPALELRFLKGRVRAGRPFTCETK